MITDKRKNGEPQTQKVGYNLENTRFIWPVDGQNVMKIDYKSIG